MPRIFRWTPKLTSSIALIAALPCALAAQTGGTLSGSVTGAGTHSPIGSVCVAIDQTACATLTDAKGNYSLRGLTAGNHTVTFSVIGSKTSQKSVTVAQGQSQTLDAALDPGPLLLNGLVVSATRVPTEASKVATTVNVLGPRDIAASPARETQDLLREIPGVESPRTSSMVGGSAQIMSIRGVDEGRTVVVSDGIPVGDAWGEWIDWGRVPKSSLDHVEVVEGGTSNLYGNGAIGGVVSFFSRPVAPGDVTVTVDGGSRSARHSYVSAGLPAFGKFTASVNGDYLDGGGYTMLDPAKQGAVDVPSQIISRNGGFRLNYAPSARLTAFLDGHVFDDTRDLGTPITLTTRNERNADLGINVNQVMSGTLQIRSWAGNLTEFQRASTIRTSSASCTVTSANARQCEDSSSDASIPSNDDGASLLWTRTNIAHMESFSIGGDYRHMGGSYYENDFSTTCPGASCGTSTRMISSGGDQSLSGVFAQAVLAPTDALRLELGVRMDRWTNNDGKSIDPVAGTVSYADRSKNAFAPRVGARYQLMRTLSVHAAYYQAFRAPNLAELYRKQISATSITLPNPDLKPEFGKGQEFGFDYQPVEWAQLKATGYTADYTDFNSPVTFTPPNPTACGVIATCRQRQNIGKSHSKGAEAFLVLRPVQPVLVTLSAGTDDDRVVSTDATNGTKINRVPSPRSTVKVSYTNAMLGTWSGMFRHEGVTTTLQGLQLTPFSVYDASAQRTVTRNLSAFMSLENVTNEQYQVNVSGTGAAALVSYGLPRTFRLGFTWAR